MVEYKNLRENWTSILERDNALGSWNKDVYLRLILNDKAGN